MPRWSTASSRASSPRSASAGPGRRRAAAPAGHGRAPARPAPGRGQVVVGLTRAYRPSNATIWLCVTSGSPPQTHGILAFSLSWQASRYAATDASAESPHTIGHPAASSRPSVLPRSSRPGPPHRWRGRSRRAGRRPRAGRRRRRWPRRARQRATATVSRVSRARHGASAPARRPPGAPPTPPRPSAAAPTRRRPHPRGGSPGARPRPRQAASPRSSRSRTRRQRRRAGRPTPGGLWERTVCSGTGAPDPATSQPARRRLMPEPPIPATTTPRGRPSAAARATATAVELEQAPRRICPTGGREWRAASGPRRYAACRAGRRGHDVGPVGRATSGAASLVDADPARSGRGLVEKQLKALPS